MTNPETSKSIFSGAARPSVKRTWSETTSSSDGNFPLRHDTSSLQHLPSALPTTSVNTTPENGRPEPKRSKGYGDRPPTIPLPDPVFKVPQKVDLHTLHSSQSSGTKRSLSGSDIPVAKAQKSKRPRLIDSGIRVPHSFNFADSSTPPSPLFFSHSRQHLRPAFPPRYSSSEAAAKMLSKTKGEESSIKTVTLPRGSYVGGSPPSSHPHTRSRGSVDRSTLSRTPTSDRSETTGQQQLLSQIGITELLEHDDRPTFIVDLAGASTQSDEALEIVFANSALMSCGNLLDALKGTTEDAGSNPLIPPSLPQFREWILNTSVGEQSFGIWPSTFIQGSMAWTASTLRKRLRVISGVFQEESRRASTSTVGPSTKTNSSSMTQTAASTAPTENSNAEPTGSTADSMDPGGAQDYFGGASVVETTEVSADTQVERHDFEELVAPSARYEQAAKTQRATSARPLPGMGYESPGYESVLPTKTTSNIDSFSFIAQPDKGVEIFDWTRIPDVESLPPHIRFARSVDWASTSLGPIEDWSADLRQMVNLIMASPHPAAMYWGKDLVAVYNEAYVFLAGQKHPKLMGQRYREAWAEIWDDVKDVFASAVSTGQATMKDDDCLFIRRNNFLEETYFSWSIIPMVGGEGTVMGLYNPAFEKTRRKVAERRMLTLREVGERTASARDIKGFWASVLVALECNEYDTPFVLLYSLANEEDSSEDASVTDSSVSGGNKQCHLEGALGVPEGHPAAPKSMDLRDGREGFAPLFREAMVTNQTLIVDSEKGEVSVALLAGLVGRGFGDAAKSCIVCPILPTTTESILGFLVMGVNPRRPYDDDYALYIQLLSRQLATSLASVVLFEEEIRRGQKAAKIAALDRIELSEQLAQRTQEAIESETKFTRMAEFAPVGMFIANSEGEITYCNDTYYEITRVPKKNTPAENWVDFVLQEDLPLVQQLWRDLVKHTKPASTEFRFKAPWIDRSGVSGETWVLFSAYPEPNEDGSLKSVFGSVTDISSQKWAEGLQKKKMEEAVELKRQQENFIDITSHEMRNPLSAILQCSDEIVTTLTEAKNKKITKEEAALYDGNIDAAQTIALCAQHQKRIVDDVLTMSKIDSALLVVTPVDVQPLTIVQQALRMFEGELSSADISMEFRVDPSFEQLQVDWVRFDPSRVLQVLINLTTNAIKFTTTEKKRTISVTVAASATRPSEVKDSIVKYVPPRPNRVEMTKGVDWGAGEPVYVQFAVQDTGRGLSDEEKKSLFLRFSQASPRTHVQYGGSGLGLFISRELTELQGGEIGVASVAGVGSTFAFFVKARRSKAPEHATELMLPSLGARRYSDGKLMTRKATVAPPRVRDFAAQEPAAKEQLKVLLVEDNLVNQRVLQKQLKKLECEVTVANHGREALDRIQESSFWHANSGNGDVLELKVVLMDQEMPVMDGITCTKTIRELEKEGKIIRHVPILGITANARPEQIQQLIEAGMDDVVSKPFRIAEIVPKVEELTTKFASRANTQGALV